MKILSPQLIADVDVFRLSTNGFLPRWSPLKSVVHSRVIVGMTGLLEKAKVKLKV